MFNIELARKYMERTNVPWIAKETGKSKRTIHNYLHGITMPCKSVAKAWAEAVGLKPDALWIENIGTQPTKKKTA